MPKKVMLVQTVREEKIIKEISHMTGIRIGFIIAAALIGLTIIFFNLNGIYGWFDVPAF